ncbi:MAG: hypothetical protein ACI9R3_001628 [Verrucomicrobiales bacterium]|jgi:hypothetical protein
MCQNAACLVICWASGATVAAFGVDPCLLNVERRGVMRISRTAMIWMLPLLVALGPIVCVAEEGEGKDEKKDDGFRELFNKKDLAGWHCPYDWGEVKVKDEEIHLKSNKKFFLLAEKEFADFIFEGEILLPDAESNSGFMIRCAAERNNVWGYQAEVDPTARGWSGGLYDEARRGWLHPKKGDAASEKAFAAMPTPFKAGEWNRYRIHAEGDHIRIWVNDTLTTDFHDAMDSQGYVGIQHHGEKGKVYRFRNLRIKELSTAAGEEIALFDGKTLTGLTNSEGGNPGAGWVVDGDTLHLKEPGKGGDLYVDGEWENLELTFEWKLAKGARGGVGYRFAAEGDNKELYGPVYAFLDHDNKKQFQDKTRRSGALFGLLGPADAAKSKKTGEFNAAKIIVYRNRITHELNGKTAVRTSTDSAPWKRAIKKSKKLADSNGFATQKGKIVLLDNGKSPLWIKNLKARVLR